MDKIEINVEATTVSEAVGISPERAAELDTKLLKMSMERVGNREKLGSFLQTFLNEAQTPGETIYLATEAGRVFGLADMMKRITHGS